MSHKQTKSVVRRIHCVVGTLLLALSVTAHAQQLKNAPEAGIYSSGQQMASLRPGHGLVWQRTSPSIQQPDGPVLYQLLFHASGNPRARWPDLIPTPGT